MSHKPRFFLFAQNASVEWLCNSHCSCIEVDSKITVPSAEMALWISKRHFAFDNGNLHTPPQSTISTDANWEITIRIHINVRWHDNYHPMNAAFHLVFASSGSFFICFFSFSTKWLFPLTFALFCIFCEHPILMCGVTTTFIWLHRAVCFQIYTFDCRTLARHMHTKTNTFCQWLLLAKRNCSLRQRSIKTSVNWVSWKLQATITTWLDFLDCCRHSIDRRSLREWSLIEKIEKKVQN